MFSYLRTKKQFFKDCKSIDQCTGGMKAFIEHATDYRKRADENFGVRDSEVESWKETFKLLNQKLSGTTADFKIALEFIHQFRDKEIHKGDKGFARRTDVMIAVKEKTNKRNVWKKKIYIIEFKQLTNIDEYKKKKEDPVSQVIDYCKLFLANNDQVSMKPDPKGEKIQLIPVVWMFNMPKPADKEIINKLKACKDGWDLKLIFKDGDITKYWKNVPKKYDNDVFKQLKKGFPVFQLHDEVKDIWESQSLFNDRKTWDKKDIINTEDRVGSKINLRGDQNVCFRDLAERICGKGEKGIFCIIGGAGSGKSLIAVLLYKYFSDNRKNVKFYIPEIAPVRAYDGPLWKMVFARAEEHTDYSIGDVVIVDEAHNLYENVYSKIINERQGKVTIFLSDGDQSDKKTQVGKICSDEKANNYYLNSQFRCNKDDGYITFIKDILNDAIPNDKPKFPFNADCLDFDVQVIDKLDDDLLDQCKLLINSDENTYKIGRRKFEKFKPKREIITAIKHDRHSYDPEDLFVSTTDKKRYGSLFDIRGLDVVKAIVVIRENDISYNNKVTVTRSHYRQDAEQKINIYRILLTRATETCYIYCEDKALRDYLVKKKRIKVYKEN